MRWIIVAIVIISLSGCAASGVKSTGVDGKLTQHYKDSLFKLTRNGMFSVELVIKGNVLSTGANMVDLIIHDKTDKDITGANITVTPWMPDMGHGVFEKPIVTERGGGLYNVENVVLTMSGRWELRVNIKKDELEDGAVFNFPDVKVKRGDKHEMKQAAAPSDLDLSTTRLSDNKTFKISYKSDVAPVPINNLHTWTLNIQTSDGRPVTGADILLDGDMPEHSHGLPTQPEVTQDLGNGNYLVEGLKFSMPGWWIMKFSIKALDKEDSVTFNLFLRE